MKSDTIRGHRLNNIYNPIFELTLIPEQIDMIDEVCKPFIIQNHKPNIGDAILYVSSAYRKEVNHMKKSEPKMILNVAFESEELDEKVQIAMEKYVEDLMLKNLDSTIEKLVVQRVTRLVSGKFAYSADGTLNGKSLEVFIREATNDIIEDVIEKNIKDILAKKIAEMI